MCHFTCLLPEPFQAAYVETTYTVIESEGQVEVCVNLTHPEFDILDQTVRVESFNDESSIYIPADAVLASESQQCICMPAYIGYTCLRI